ncbi:rhomboid family intramembrane serine protease [Flavobacteriales bacterium]|nr:rhomboid family intramembrane serine protease [Flavobacteriales bacterium]
MGSFPNDHVDATPNPNFGGTSSTNSSIGDGAQGPSNGAQNEPTATPGSGAIAPGARPWRSHRRPGVRFNGPPPEEVKKELEADRRRIQQSLIVTIGCLVIVWGAFLINLQFNLGLNRFGNRPLRTEGLVGVLSMAFLHGGWEHIWGNTVSFFTLSSMLLYFYRGIGLKVLFWTWLGSGVLLWTSGASGNHIGLSGVVYALAAFLFLSGVIRRHAILMRVALVVVFLYGSIVWGVFPIEVGVSWQGHLAGAFVGGLLAVVWRKEGPQPPPLPPEEEESELDEALPGMDADVAHGEAGTLKSHEPGSEQRGPLPGLEN